MAQIPQQPESMTPEQAFARLQEWFVQKRDLAIAKVSEVLNRKELSAFYFPAPSIGTNRMDLGDGFDLKLVHKQNVTVDEAAVEQVTAAQIKKLKLPWEELFNWKPTLVKSVYDDLTAEQKKFVDTLLEIKDATPDLDIVPRANYEAAQAHAEAAVQAAAAPESYEGQRITGIDDPDDAQPGDYYEDGEGQWWLFNEQSDWVTCDDPNAPAKPAKPKRTRKAK